MTDTILSPELPDEPAADANPDLQQPRLWRGNGWTARVIKNDDDEGWAVAMYKDGEPEPALVGPWTMGRDKKNPKPLDSTAFRTLIKTASEVIRRHEQHLHALLHKAISVNSATEVLSITLDIIPDDEFPYALLTAHDEAGDRLAQVQVAPTFKLNSSSAAAWVENDFRKPG